MDPGYCYTLKTAEGRRKRRCRQVNLNLFPKVGETLLITLLPTMAQT